MSALSGLFIAWAAVSVVFLILVIYRSRLTKGETDWIPLSDDAKEDQAIKAQTAIEGKTKKLNVPIHALGTLSVVMLLVMLGVWIYQGIMTAPEIPK